MIGRLSLSFVVVAITGFIVAACGRQVTPNPPGLGPGGAPPGYMTVFFNVASTFNFSTYQYMVVFNTSGNGVTPSTDTLQTNWAGYDFAIMARGNGISSFAQAIKFVRNTNNPHIPPATYPLQTTPQIFSYNLNANGTGSEFSVLMQRHIFDSSPSPSPSASPPSLWTFNAFVTEANVQGQWQFYDSMGFGGPTDPQFVSPQLCMTEPFDITKYATYTPSDPTGQITTIEIANNPVSPTPCP